MFVSLKISRGLPDVFSGAGEKLQTPPAVGFPIMSNVKVKRAGNRGSVSGFPQKKYAFSGFPWLFF